METPNICVLCRKDCSFFAKMDGFCLPCGDMVEASMKENPRHWMGNIVAGGRQVEQMKGQLIRAVKVLETARNLLYNHAPHPSPFEALECIEAADAVLREAKS